MQRLLLDSSVSIRQTVCCAIRMSAVFLCLCGLLYMPAVTITSGIFFGYQASGSLVTQQDKHLGSLLAAQPFVSQHYFHPRPSAIDFDPTATGGSNLAPSNPELAEIVAMRRLAVEQREMISANEMPVDMLSASGSGIDPHISPATAYVQVRRVARARAVSLTDIEQLVTENTEGKQWYLFGQPRVNVLQLNLALDKQFPILN